MHFSLPRRLSLLLCGGLLMFALLAGVIIQGAADFPPGPTKTARVIIHQLAGIIVHDATNTGATAFHLQPDLSGKTASITVPAGIIIQD